MKKEKALEIIENMPETEFQKWFKSLPYRVQYACRLTDWRKILPEWYLKEGNQDEN